jgi:hypothetical protein
LSWTETGLNGITLLEKLSKWMFGQFYAHLAFIVLEGSLEKDL